MPRRATHSRAKTARAARAGRGSRPQAADRGGHRLLGLQRSVGNLAVNELLSQPLQRREEEVPPWESLPQSAAPEPAPWEALPQSKGPSVSAAKPAAKAPKPDEGSPKSQGGVYKAVKGA